MWGPHCSYRHHLVALVADHVTRNSLFRNFHTQVVEEQAGLDFARNNHSVGALMNIGGFARRIGRVVGVKFQCRAEIGRPQAVGG